MRSELGRPLPDVSQAPPSPPPPQNWQGRKLIEPGEASGAVAGSGTSLGAPARGPGVGGAYPGTPSPTPPRAAPAPNVAAGGRGWAAPPLPPARPAEPEPQPERCGAPRWAGCPEPATRSRPSAGRNPALSRCPPTPVSRRPLGGPRAAEKLSLGAGGELGAEVGAAACAPGAAPSSPAAQGGGIPAPGRRPRGALARPARAPPRTAGRPRRRPPSAYCPRGVGRGSAGPPPCPRPAEFPRLAAATS